MRKYQLYLIEDEFASHYFGRERMFFHLFKEKEKAKGDFAEIVTKQIKYITKPIPSLRIHQLIHQQIGKAHDLCIENGLYTITLNGKLSTSSMKVCEGVILVGAEGSFEAETVFFEILRKCEPSFLAVDLDHQKFGWLKPIKERKFV